jgi:CRISPR type IV-associated protein Csf3
MTPFRVTWTLASPMAVPLVPIHLDGLLSWARVHEAENAGSEDPWAQQHDLPLERFETAKGWCFKASWVQLHAYDDEMPFPMHVVRRSDVTEFARAWESGLLGRKVPLFDPARGLTKGASLQHSMRSYHSATAFGVGDLDGVRRLLGHVHSLGKLRRRSAGRIVSVEVAAFVQAAEAWRARHLPQDAEAKGYVSDIGALRAPYWKRETFVPVQIPIDA